MRLRFDTKELLGIAACHVSCDVHAIPCADALYSRSNADHTPCGVCARSIGKLWFDRISAGALVRLERIHAGSVNLHENLSRAGLQIGNGLDLQHLRSAELLNSDRSHRLPAYFFAAPRR